MLSALEESKVKEIINWYQQVLENNKDLEDTDEIISIKATIAALQGASEIYQVSSDAEMLAKWTEVTPTDGSLLIRDDFTPFQYWLWDSTETNKGVYSGRDVLHIAAPETPLENGTGVEIAGQIYTKIKAEITDAIESNVTAATNTANANYVNIQTLFDSKSDKSNTGFAFNLTTTDKTNIVAGVNENKDRIDVNDVLIENNKTISENGSYAYNLSNDKKVLGLKTERLSELDALIDKEKSSDFILAPFIKGATRLGVIKPNNSNADFSSARSTEKTYTDVNGKIQVAAISEPAFDFQYGSPVITLEPTITTLIKNSLLLGTFPSDDWNDTNSSGVLLDSEKFDQAKAVKIELNDSIKYISQSFTSTSGTIFNASIYIEHVEGDLSVENILNLTNSTDKKYYENDIEILPTSTISSGNYYKIVAESTSTSQEVILGSLLGEGVGTFVFSLPQVVQGVHRGSFIISPIGSTATRNADSGYISGDLTGLIPRESTKISMKIFIESTLLASTYTRTISFYNDNQYIEVLFNHNGTIFFNHNDGNTSGSVYGDVGLDRFVEIEVDFSEMTLKADGILLGVSSGSFNLQEGGFERIKFGRNSQAGGFLGKIEYLKIGNNNKKVLSNNLDLSKVFEQETLDFIQFINDKGGVIGDIYYVDSFYKKLKSTDGLDLIVGCYDINFGYWKDKNSDLNIPNLGDLNSPLKLVSGSYSIEENDKLNNRKNIVLSTGTEFSNFFADQVLPLSRMVIGSGGISAITSKPENSYTYNMIGGGDLKYLLRSQTFYSYYFPAIVEHEGFIHSAIFNGTTADIIYDGNHVREIAIGGSDYNNVHILHNPDFEEKKPQTFAGLLDIKSDNVDRIKDLQEFLNDYYKAYDDYREGAPFKLEDFDSIPFTPDGGNMYYPEIHEMTAFPSITNDDSDKYFMTWSTDHDATVGGLYWGTFTNLDLSDFSYKGKFLDSDSAIIPTELFQAETASMIYEHSDPDGKKLYCYFQLGGGNGRTTQGTYLMKATGGRLHEADWEFVGEVFPANKLGYGAHTGYQRVSRLGLGKVVSWGLNSGGGNGSGVYSVSKDGRNWLPYKIEERTNGIIPSHLNPPKYNLSGPFTPMLNMDNKNYMFGYPSPIGVSGAWDIDEVLGTFVVEMQELDQPVKVYKVSDLPRGAVLVDGSGYIYMYFFDVKTNRILIQKSTEGRLTETGSGKGLRLPWEFPNTINTTPTVNDVADVSYSITKFDVNGRINVTNNNPTINIEGVFYDEYQRIELLFKGRGTMTITYNSTDVAINVNPNKQLANDTQYTSVILEYQGIHPVSGKQVVLVSGELKDI